MDDVTLVKYDAVARALHWIIACAIIVEITLGLGHEAWKNLFPAMFIHKATGLTILALSLARLAWRLGHRPPPLPAVLPTWQKSATIALHGIFYTLMIMLPLTGLVFVSSFGHPISWFGLFDIPNLPVVKNSLLANAAHETHEILALLFIPLILLHIGAALYHHHVARDTILRRML